MNSGQLRVGKGYIMVTVGQQGELKENITELHIIVRTTGFSSFLFLRISTLYTLKLQCRLNTGTGFMSSDIVEDIVDGQKRQVFNSVR